MQFPPIFQKSLPDFTVKNGTDRFAKQKKSPCQKQQGLFLFGEHHPYA